MKVILLTDVSKIGKKNDIVEVKDGYGKNFILKRKLGLIANKENLQKLEKIKQEEKIKKEKYLKELKTMKDEIEKNPLIIKHKIGIKNKLIGGTITKEYIKKELKKVFNFNNIETKNILLDKPIKEKGIYNIILKMDYNFEINLKIIIEEEK